MSLVYSDCRWSWVVAAACCWVTFVVQGLVRSSGVVYVALIDAYGVSRAQASWPFTLRIAVWNLSGPLAGALSYRWSIRTIAFAGVLLVSATNVLCWFTDDIGLITLLLGGLQGLGVGTAVTLIPVIINQYFSRYKSTGMGIACAGATAGSFALPPIVEYAIEEYGLRGAFLMMAGITLHGVLGAALLRPPAHCLLQPRKKAAPKQQDKCGDQNLNFLAAKPEAGSEEEEEESTRLGEAPVSKSVRFDCPETDGEEKNSLLERSAKVLVRKSGESGIRSTDSTRLASLQETTGTSAGYGKLELVVDEAYDPRINILSSSDRFYSTVDGTPLHSAPIRKKKWLLSAISEPSVAAWQIVQHPMFLVIASNFSVFFLSYMTFLIVIVDHSLDMGVDRTDSVFLVSAFSVADLCGRLGSGWVTDSGLLRRKHLMMGSMLTVGGLLVATPFTTTYLEITAVSASCGLIVGVNLILFYALLEEYLGLRQMPMAVGLMNFSIGVISLITPILTGYFRDTMGSYDHLFHFLGGLVIACGLLWTFEPFYVKQKKAEQLKMTFLS